MKGLLIGCGAMAQAYVPVLKQLGADIQVMGRGQESAERFYAATGIRAGVGALDRQLDDLDSVPDFAIVAVDVVQLAEVASILVQRGVGRILLEKPGGVDPQQVLELSEQVSASQTQVCIAYNRRFFSSVLMARELILEDGGVISSKFDFTELLSRIPLENKDPRELSNFFYANSTHLIDLHTYLCGEILEISPYVAGSLAWHPAGSIFAGFGRTDRGAIFSYHANWESPGRWRMDIMTPKRRLVFEPLEELQQQLPSGFGLQQVTVDRQADIAFKPGLLRMTEDFLTNAGRNLPSLKQQASRMSVYELFLRKPQ